MKNFNLADVLKSLKAVSKIDEGLDELVFGHSLGFLGEKATDEDKEKLERVVSVVGNLLSNLRDEDEEECDCNEDDDWEDEDEPTIVGMRMKVDDNNYITCVETGNRASLYGKEVVIESEPYSKYFNGHNHDMVKVFYPTDGRRYEVLYNASGLVEEED